MIKERTYKIKLEREFGHSFYLCGKCKIDITSWVKKNFDKIFMKLLKGKSKYGRCPKCKSKINWGGISPRISIVPIKK